jgi:hypothetical protein
MSFMGHVSRREKARHRGPRTAATDRAPIGPDLEHVSQSRHRTVRPNGRCSVLTVSRAPISFTPLGGFGRLVGCSVAGPRVRFSGSTLRNGGAARRILKGAMAYQILLDAALIIVAMGALHRFEARLVRPAYAPRTRRARPVPNPWSTRRCGRHNNPSSSDDAADSTPMSRLTVAWQWRARRSCHRSRSAPTLPCYSPQR